MGQKQHILYYYYYYSLVMVAAGLLVLEGEGRRIGSSGVLISGGFVQTRGSHFVLNGNTFYLNGFNAYWMMLMASGRSGSGSGQTNEDQAGIRSVACVLDQASSHGLTVGRTWAFSDGGAFPLQITPGTYDEVMFKGLDYVVSEAGRKGIRLILSLANNNPDFGGKKQYVEWGRESGQNLTSDDDFYRNDVVKGYYKNHVKTVLTRINTITKIAYKDDPTIFAWELINEPRCESDLSGRTLQAWVSEMGGYVKSMDGNHLVEVGSEGFYGTSTPGKQALNPFASLYGSDFISNNRLPGVDFATIHAYPDIWLSGYDENAQLSYLQNWTQAHIQDTAQMLQKPLLFTEFGKSINRSASSSSSVVAETERDSLLSLTFDMIYNSARGGGPLSGGLFWHLFAPGMDHMSDGYQIILTQSPSTAQIIARHSKRMSDLNHVPLKASLEINRCTNGRVERTD